MTSPAPHRCLFELMKVFIEYIISSAACLRKYIIKSIHYNRAIIVVFSN